MKTLLAIALLTLTMSCSDRATLTAPGRVDTLYISNSETGVDSGTISMGTSLNNNTVIFYIDTSYLDTVNHTYTGSIHVDFDWDGFGTYRVYAILDMYMEGRRWAIVCSGQRASWAYFKMPWIKKMY